LLESSTDLETLYRKAALRNNIVSLSTEEEVDLHYICFVKSLSNLFYEINSNANKSIITNVILEENQNLLKLSALKYVRRCIARSEEDVHFSLLALVYNIINLR